MRTSIDWAVGGNATTGSQRAPSFLQNWPEHSEGLTRHRASNHEPNISNPLSIE
jgi:hypothetical protein